MARAKLTAFVGLNTTRFQRGLRTMRRRWRAFRTSVMAPLASFGRMVGRTMVRAGIVIGAALIGAVKHANGFRVEMAKVSTMLKKGKDDVTEYTEQVIKLAGEFGQTKSSLTKGLFDILSAGIKASEGMEFLRVASKAAVGGSTDVATSVDALTTIVNAYGLAAKDATGVSDVLFQVVRDGKIEYEEIAEEIGKVAPTAKVAGLSLKKLGAIIATAVKVEKPARAITALRAGIEVAAKDGLDLIALARKFEGKDLGAIKRAGINRRAAQAVAILASNIKLLDKELLRMENSAGQAGDAFNKMMKVRKWQPLWETILGVITRVGMAIDTALAPAVEALTKKMAALADSPKFKAFLEKVQSAAQNVIGIVAAIAGGGSSQEKALRGLKIIMQSIIVGAFSKGIALLMKAVPRLAFALGEAFMAGAKAVGAHLGQRSAAKGVVEKQFEREGKFRAEKTPFGTVKKIKPEFIKEFNQRVEEELRATKARDMNAKLGAIMDNWKAEIDDGTTTFTLGMKLLKEAAAEGSAAIAISAKTLEASSEQIAAAQDKVLGQLRAEGKIQTQKEGAPTDGKILPAKLAEEFNKRVNKELANEMKKIAAAQNRVLKQLLEEGKIQNRNDATGNIDEKVLPAALAEEFNRRVGEELANAKINTVGDNIELLDPGAGLAEEQKNLTEENVAKVRKALINQILKDIERDKRLGQGAEGAGGTEELMRRFRNQLPKQLEVLKAQKAKFIGEEADRGGDVLPGVTDIPSLMDAAVAQAVAQIGKKPLPSKDFSELRKMGANILKGGAAANPVKKAEGQREKMIKKLEKMTKNSDTNVDVMKQIKDVLSRQRGARF